MNIFNKNPFIKESKTKLVNYNITDNNKKNIEDIKDKMNKMKYRNNIETNEQIINNQNIPNNTFERIENLRNIDRQ